jgi:hypothetical protein
VLSSEVNRRTIILPVILLFFLMGAAVGRYSLLIRPAPWVVIGAFVLVGTYMLLWLFLKPDRYSMKAGLVVGLLFIGKVGIEQLTTLPIRPSHLTIVLFLAFGIIAILKSYRTGNMTDGIKSCVSSAILGTLIALCFVFLIDFLVPGTIAEAIRNASHPVEFSEQGAFVFYNTFSGADNRLIISLVASIVIGAGGGVVGMLLSKLNPNKTSSLN